MANFEVQKQHVKRTWAMAKDAADVAGVMFYKRLFETTPEVMGLFQSSNDEEYLKRQSRRLFRMITAAVDLLDKPVELFSLLEEAGGAHVGYGVKYAHYDKAGAALLWTLESALGKDVFTDEVKDAWVTVWMIIRANMLAGSMAVYESQIAELKMEASTPKKVSLSQAQRIAAGLGLLSAAALGGIVAFFAAASKSSGSSS